MSRPTLRLFDGYDHTSPGLRGEVRLLQEKLTAFGAQLDTDGLFGRGTESALLRFQAEHQLHADGIAGRRTWAALLGETPQETENPQETTIAREDPNMTPQLAEAEKYRQKILDEATRIGVAPSIICGIGSRESHWGLILQPAGPAGTGDFIRRRTPKPWRPGDLPPDGGGFGRGLMQIDFDAHEFARGEDWKDPEKNIHYGCEVLRQNIALLNRRTSLEGAALLQAAIAAYNCGGGNVLRALADGHEVDYFTHGRDYSRNVLNRSGWFQLRGWA